MANAYLNGLSTAQASATKPFAGSAPNTINPYSGANASQLFNPSQGWNAPTFVGAHNPKMGPGRFAQKTGAVSWNAGNNNGIYWSDTGPKGAGYYQTNAPEKSLLNEQQFYANQFNQNIPEMSNQLTGQAAGAINRNMNQGIQNTRQANSGRGLLYGGINQGQEGQVRNQAATQLASAKSSINQGLIDAGQKMQGQAIQTGVSYQQMQQALNNAVYKDAMDRLAATGQAAGQVLGTVGAVVGTVYGGGAGGAAGYKAGESAGQAMA